MANHALRRLGFTDLHLFMDLPTEPVTRQAWVITAYIPLTWRHYKPQANEMIIYQDIGPARVAQIDEFDFTLPTYEPVRHEAGPGGYSEIAWKQIGGRVDSSLRPIYKNAFVPKS